MLGLEDNVDTSRTRLGLEIEVEAGSRVALPRNDLSIIWLNIYFVMFTIVVANSGAKVNQMRYGQPMPSRCDVSATHLSLPPAIGARAGH